MLLSPSQHPIPPLVIGREAGQAEDDDSTMPKHVLVVDDDDSIRGLVSALLRREGFVVDDVESGNAAIGFINQKTYDAVVLDLMMRDGTGNDVLQRIAVRRPNVKCVVVISAASPANIAAMDPANIEAKLRKPFDIYELLAAVRNCTA